MVQDKSKSRRNGQIWKLLNRLRSPQIYIPWLSQSLRHLRPDAVFSAMSAMREVRISRQRLRRPERHGPMFEILEQRIYMSALPTPFANIDIGAPTMTGTAIYMPLNNQIQATGAGTGIAGTSDQFNYTAENWTGSGTLQTNVGTVANTGANGAIAQAGVMIRDTSAAGSEFAAVLENPNGTVSFEYRGSTGSAVTVSTTATAISPGWVKLSETQSGTTDSFTGLYSTDGVNWTQINTTPINITFTGATNLAGLAVTSGNAAQSQTVNFNSFSATPASFTNQDIGSPGIAGSATYNPSAANWTVNGGGSDIWGTSDQFNFASENFTGDGSIVAEVNSQTNTNSWAKAGVMFRNDNTAGSAFAAVVVTPGNGVGFEWRGTSGGSCVYEPGPDVNAPIWIKITRVGDSFAGYYSDNGVSWIQLGSFQSVAMDPTSMAGLAVTAHDNTQISTATFSHVAITDPNLPSGWSDQDIGGPQYLGSADYSAGVWTVVGGGTDIWGTSDQFNFAGESWTGDGTIVAQVNSQINTNSWAKAGVMFRNDSTAGSAFADVVVTPGNGVNFQWRSTTGGSCGYAQVMGITAPVWVKLARTGTNYSGYYSTDGTTWVQIGASENITFSNTQILAGLAVTAHNNGAESTVAFSNVYVGTGSAPGAAITGVTATAVGSGRVNLSWSDPNAPGTDANYLVERSTDGVNYAPVESVPMGMTTYSDEALQAGTQYYYEVYAQNAFGLSPVSKAASVTTGASPLAPTASEWNSTDVGVVPIAGSASYSGGTFTVTGSGDVAPNTSALYYIGTGQDNFQYTYQSLGNNGQIVAEVTSQSNTGNFAQSGLMLRAAGGNDAVFGGIFITPEEGVEFLSRSSQGAVAVMMADISYSPPATGAPVWLKLTTQGGVITGYISVDGTNWSQIGQATVNLGGSATAGLVVGGNSASAASTATFSNVALGAITSSNVVPEMAQSIHTEVYSGSDGRVVWRPIPGATSITVQQLQTGSTQWNTVSGTVGIPGTADTWLPTGLLPNTTYSYRIQASNANGSSPWSPVVALTTGSSSKWGPYTVSVGASQLSAACDNDVVSINSNLPYVYADSWQQALLRGSTGTANNYTLGTSFPIGNFAAASTGQGYYGNSYSVYLPNISSSPSYSLPAYTVGFDDTAAEYYYIGGQNDGSGVTQANDTTSNVTIGSTISGNKPATSKDPIAYANGTPEVSSPGLSATGFANNWQVQLSYTTMTVNTPNSIYGNGWSTSGGQSYLTGTDSGDPNNENIIVVFSPYSQAGFLYNLTAQQYESGPNATGDTIVHNASNDTYTITLRNGSQYVYYDLSTQNQNENLQGILKQTTDAYGDVTTFTYTQNVGQINQLTSVTQTDAAGDKETFTYSYLPGGFNTVNGGNVSLITQSIQRAGASTPTLFRQMVLTYYDGSYTGDMQYGNAGDLQSVTIEDGSGKIIQEAFYRYYTPTEINAGAPDFLSGLQYEFGPQSAIQSQEAVAAYNKANGTSYDIFSAPSAVIAPYADQYYQYNSDHQVTLQVAGGVGGTASNGLGTYLLSYYQNPNYATQAAQYVSQNPGAAPGSDLNIWLTRTTETNPDGSRQVVYTNVDGETLLQMTLGNSDTPISMTAYTYDGQGQILEAINPSAINLNASILNPEFSHQKR